MNLFPLKDFLTTRALIRQANTAHETDTAIEKVRNQKAKLTNDITLEIATAALRYSKGEIEEALENFPNFNKREIGEIFAAKSLPTNGELKNQVASILDSIFRLGIMDTEPTGYRSPAQINPNLKTVVGSLVVEDLTELALERVGFSENEDLFKEPVSFDHSDDDDDDDDDWGLNELDAWKDKTTSRAASPNEVFLSGSPINDHEALDPDDDGNTEKDDIKKDSINSLITISDIAVPYLFSRLEAGLEHLRSIKSEVATPDVDAPTYTGDGRNSILDLLAGFDLRNNPEQIKTIKTILFAEYDNLCRIGNGSLPDENELVHNDLERVIKVLSAFQELDYDGDIVKILTQFLKRYSEKHSHIACLKALSKFPENSFLLNKKLKALLIQDLRDKDDASSYYAASILSNAAPNSFNKADIAKLLDPKDSAADPGVVASILINIGKKDQNLRNKILDQIWANLLSDLRSDHRADALIISELSPDLGQISRFLSSVDEIGIPRPVEILIQAVRDRVSKKLSLNTNPQDSNIYKAFTGDIDYLLESLDQNSKGLSQYLLLYAYDTKTIDKIKDFVVKGRHQIQARDLAIEVLHFIAINKDDLLQYSNHHNDDLDDDDDIQDSPINHYESIFSQANKVSHKILLGNASAEISKKAIDALAHISTKKTLHSAICGSAMRALNHLGEKGKAKLETIINRSTDPTITKYANHLLRGI